MIMGDFLRVHRLRQRLTQKELAARLGKHQSFVCKYEERGLTVGLNDFIRITRALGLKPHRALRQVLQPQAVKVFVASSSSAGK